MTEETWEDRKARAEAEMDAFWASLPEAKREYIAELYRRACARSDEDVVAYFAHKR